MHPFAEKMARARAAAAKRRKQCDPEYLERQRKRHGKKLYPTYGELRDAAARSTRSHKPRGRAPGRGNPELLLLTNPAKKRKRKRGRNPVKLEAGGEPTDMNAAAALRYAQERANSLDDVVKVWRDGRAYHLTVGQRSTHAGVHYATATPEKPSGGRGLRRVNPLSKRRLLQQFDGEAARNMRQLRAAAAAYKRFHGIEPETAIKVPGSDPVLIAMGQLKEIVYKPTKGERKGPAFFHVFGRGAWLAATPDGKKLVLVAHPRKPFRVKWDRGIVG